jgi:Rrf2 family iron-sulfur cluster assembly transcriptional regulator
MFFVKEMIMQITTKTEYAVRALAEMAMINAEKPEKPVSIRGICERQNLPVKYVEQLFRKLKKKGYIRSIHGAHGGYFFDTDHKALTILDIMVAVEENKVSVQCDRTAPDMPTYCCGTPCGFYGLWSEITNKMNNYLSEISLGDVLKRLENQE